MNSHPRSARSARTRRCVAAVATAVAIGTIASAVPASASADAAPTPTPTPTAAAANRPTGLPGRGSLLHMKPIGALDHAQVAQFVARAGLDAASVRYGVRAYRLTYRTTDPYGRTTLATGLFVLPDGGRRTVGIVSDTHGTMAHRDNAPSVGEGLGRLAPYLHASAGRAVAAPDYLGLGMGPGRHPYMDTASAVTATVDMLRASRTAARMLGRPLTGDVYATGFSQGGQVAMALGRTLHKGADPRLRLRALAPVSGPYDLVNAELPGIFDGSVNDTSAVFYLAYFLTAQNRIHPVYRTPADAFRQPYAARIEQLFDGSHAEEDIVKALPGTLKELLTADFYRQVRRPEGGLLRALRAQDGACGWKPAAPVRLYTASGDTDVPISNARSCARHLAAHSTKAPVLDQGKVDHFGAFKSAEPKIVSWFNAVELGPVVWIRPDQ
ncbi:alpha/beta hydrolase [Streptomyces sp. NPDC020681]|uniref:alpha/beta hydrolase n=1 Tax=Streptomyces sp. NPDC020681 TaxID=3365083 RepID=UPI0037874636